MTYDFDATNPPSDQQIALIPRLFTLAAAAEVAVAPLDRRQVASLAREAAQAIAKASRHILALEAGSRNWKNGEPAAREAGHPAAESAYRSGAPLVAGTSVVPEVSRRIRARRSPRRRAIFLCPVPTVSRCNIVAASATLSRPVTLHATPRGGVGPR